MHKQGGSLGLQPQEPSPSFSNVKEIEHQFRLDFPRMNLVFNNQLLNRSACPNGFIQASNHSLNPSALLACCTQAALVYPLQMLQKLVPIFVFGEPLGSSPVTVMVTLNAQKESILIVKRLQAFRLDKDKEARRNSIWEARIHIDMKGETRITIKKIIDM